LVVEDDDDIARFIQLALREIGMDSEVIHNGQRALDRLKEVAPDAVVLDLNIPTVSGLDVMRALRANAALARAKVIVVSGNPHMTDQAYELADLVLHKPISFDQLRDLMRRLFK
jgi:DNA-binding response OmpR family regulator